MIEMHETPLTAEIPTVRQRRFHIVTWEASAVQEPRT